MSAMEYALDPLRDVRHNSARVSDLALFAEDLDWSGTETTRPVSFLTGANWVRSYHYLGTLPSHATAYGLFCPDMIALVAFGQPSNDHGVAAKLGLEQFVGNVEIVRVAVHPSAPKNTTSHAIAAAIRRFSRDRPEVEWLFSYADTGQNHHGGIYQALGAVYVGQTPPVYGWLLNGEAIHPRSVVARYGTNAREATPLLAEQRGEHLEYVPGMNAPKHTYVIPIGDARSRRAVRRALRFVSLPYPKRAPEDSKASHLVANEEGQVRSLVGALDAA